MTPLKRVNADTLAKEEWRDVERQMCKVSRRDKKQLRNEKKIRPGQKSRRS